MHRSLRLLFSILVFITTGCRVIPLGLFPKNQETVTICGAIAEFGSWKGFDWSGRKETMVRFEDGRSRSLIGKPVDLVKGKFYIFTVDKLTWANGALTLRHTKEVEECS